MTGYPRTVSAVVASFAVYLMPIAGPRPGWLGAVISRALGGGTGPDLAWVAIEVAVALAAQVVLFLLAYWFLGGPGLFRGLGSAAALLPMVLFLSHAYGRAIPARSLVEADTAPERAAPTVCQAPDVRLADTMSSVSVAPDDPIWVVRAKQPQRYGLLEVATCTVKVLEHDSAGSVIRSAAGARALYSTIFPVNGRRAWFVIDARSGHLTPVDVQGVSTILSTDGRVTAWLRPVPGGSPLQLEAVMRDVDGPSERVVSLRALGRGDLDLAQVDPVAGSMVVSRPGRELFVVGMDGSLRETLPVPSDVRPQHRSFRFLRQGWVVWDWVF